MQKNIAGQFIGVQMVSASDGSAFTGSVTVYVTGDAGTQAIGSVGSGVCTHEGNGYHTYAPAQAETNSDLIAFTFVGSGAVPVTVQVYTAINPVTAVPTAAENGAAGWDRMLVDHTSTGSMGYVLNALFALLEYVTGWRFKASAFSEAPAGDVTVNITPAYVSQQAVVDNNKVTIRRGSRGWVLLTVTDATTGDPIDLSVYTGLKFLVGPAGEATVQTQNVTAFGADNNQFYWKPNEASTQKERQLNWSLFNDIDDTASQYYRAKPADGVINVLESPV